MATRGRQVRASELPSACISRISRRTYSFSFDPIVESRVLVLYTGGTIGMVRNNSGILAPTANALVHSLRRYPDLHDETYAQGKFKSETSDAPLVLPHIEGKRRVIYSILEYDPLLDSSNMTMEDWSRMAEDIKRFYTLFDGFVVLHGTDTLAFSASALSFMLEGLSKPVVITGSQIPMVDARSDGKSNFLSALVLAGNCEIPEVTVFFGEVLLRGNRTVKASVGSLRAFTSPNCRPLATVGVRIEVDFKSIIRPPRIDTFTVHSTLNRNVGLLRLFPGITTQMVRAFLQPPLEGAVLQSFGAGNVPSNREDLLAEFKAATSRGVVLVNCTQCQQGVVMSVYETGKALIDVGVTPGSDMTPEAGLTKLAYVLSKSEWDVETKRQMMQSCLRGELTVPRSQSYNGCENRDGEDEFGKDLMAARLCAAVVKKDVARVEEILENGADVNCVTPGDRRSALHVACTEGDAGIVRHLLLAGASQDILDRHGRSPLMDAVTFDHHETISVLRSFGASLQASNYGNLICEAAAKGDVMRLKSYQLAGADLGQTDLSGRTPLHMAALFARLQCVSLLLEAKVSREPMDALGDTPSDLAARRNYGAVLNMLECAD
ncbi:L-asparaginase 1 [Neocloeon triangulifer]|uniref:L-asparaginase 1 n=1 Tax=Neocloeon triangulifer TaxID=2078957 RepID=UPI00286ED69F|nr:L-asparaginase 1 [Neocloeon triangulifer]